MFRSHAATCRLPLLVLMLLLMLTVTGAAATPAKAAPTESTLSLARLTEMLSESPSGTVPGYFKTVIKGSRIDEIPCALMGIVSDAAVDGGDLILFQASGTVMDTIGGVAAGMSGSPVYVDDGGWKLVGAVSYGDIFTTGGLGLATPIEHMMALETDYPTARDRVVELTTPIATSSGVVTGLRFSASAAATARASRRPTSMRLMRPLASLSVAGLPQDSFVYRELEKRLKNRGVELAAGLAGSASGPASTFETPLVPGAAVGALVTRGAVTYGGIGTVTYTTADGRLAAFGHPFGPIVFYDPTGDGATGYYLCNADIIGVWGSTYEPYKMAQPGAIRGTVYRDSGAGILGLIGSPPAESRFSSTATMQPGGATQETTVWSPQWSAADPLNTYLMATLTYPAIYQATGDGAFSGTMAYTLDIVVSDGADEFTIHRSSAWDSSVDAPFMATCEQSLYFDKLLADPYGIAPCTIKSVDVVSTLAATHDRAVVGGISVPGGLHVGANTVRVKLWQHGQTEPRWVDVPLTLPKGTDSRHGQLYAAAPDTGVVDEGGGWFGISDPVDGDTWNTPVPRRTLGELVAAINAVPAGDEVQVAYDTVGNDWTSEQRPWDPSATIGSAATGSCLSGIEELRTSLLRLRASRSRIPLGGKLVLRGSVRPTNGDTVVHLYARDAEGHRRHLADVPATVGDSSDYYSSCLFSRAVKGLRHTATLTAVWDGDDRSIGSTGTRRVRVVARVKLTAAARAGRTVSLTARVRPGDTGGAVAFERRTTSGWQRIAEAKVNAGLARAVWHAGTGTWLVRARFLGSRLNAAASSAVRTVGVR
jgi:hypothetical protein